MNCDFKKIYKMTDQIFIGFNGLQSDAQTLAQLLTYEVNSYKLRENREISPEAFASLVRTIQYKHRFGPYFVEPVIAGLDKVCFHYPVYPRMECPSLTQWIRLELVFINPSMPYRQPVRRVFLAPAKLCMLCDSPSLVVIRRTWNPMTCLRSSRRFFSPRWIVMHTADGERKYISSRRTRSRFAN